MYQHWNEYGCLEFKVFGLIFTLGIAEFDFDFAFYFIFWVEIVIGLMLMSLHT